MMPSLSGFVLLVLSAAALLLGAVIERRQRSTAGPIALAPTLQYALAAALLAGLGMGALRAARVAWVSGWYSPLAVVVVLAFGVWLISVVGARAERGAGR